MQDFAGLWGEIRSLLHFSHFLECELSGGDEIGCSKSCEVLHKDFRHLGEIEEN